MSLAKKYGFLWVTLGFLLISFAGHWLFGWWAYVNEAQAESQPIEVGVYLVEMTRDTLENWQSEFLQLIWQVAGLAFLLHVGSPSSKEGHDRLEAKLDYLLVRGEGGRQAMEEFDARFPRK